MFSTRALGASRTLRLALAALGVILPTSALAFDLDPSEIRGKSSKEPMTVLQNRYFLKAWRPEVGFLVGQVLDEAYLSTQVVGVRSSLFFNEWLGAEVQSVKTVVRDSEDRRALNGLKYRPYEEGETSGDAVPETEDTIVTPDPEVNALHSMTDVNAIAAPFYGKLNVLNKWILYTDIYLAAGWSRVETDQGDKGAAVLGIGERFYVGKSWSFRIDFRDRMFSETRSGQPTRKNAYTVDLGASWFLN